MFNTFHITTLSFSCFNFIIVLPISQTLRSLTSILFTTCSTDVDQVLITAIKFVADFVTLFGCKTVKAISNLYVLTDLVSSISTIFTAYISIEWIQADLTM